MQHDVPGGLCVAERRQLYEERLRAGGPTATADVSDLGLTMDDIEGSVGGFFV